MPKYYSLFGKGKMEPLFHFLASFVAVTLDVISMAMMLRVVFSLFFDSEESKIAIFLACITEPFVAPVRFLLAKFNILQDTPIDWSFTVSYLLIILLRLILPPI